MRTTQDYLDMMAHALGKTPDSRHKLINTLNDAGRALVNSHEWTWKTRAGKVLELVANQDYIDLPDDFGAVISVTSVGGSPIVIHQTTVEDIANRRSWDNFDSLNLFIAFNVGGEGLTDEDGVSENRALLWPTPQTARSDLRLSYRTRWVDLEAEDPDRVPVIPRDWERSLMLFANAFAWDTENKANPYENEALFGATGEIQRLILLDAGKQSDQGRPAHSVISRSRAGQSFRPFTRINPPS